MNSTPSPLPSPQQRILQESTATQWWGWIIAALLAGLLVPVLILVAGVVAILLEQGGLESTRVVLGRSLVVPVPAQLVSLEPIAQLTWLVGFGFLLAALQSAVLYLFYRGVYARTRSLSRRVHEQVLATSIQVASAEGITAQQMRTRDLIEHQLPKLEAGLVARWRALPRSLVLALLCTAIAIAVDLWLTLLAIISGLIVWLLYRTLERSGEARTATFDVPQIQQRLVDAVRTAPLVSRVRGDEAPVDDSGGPLGRLMEARQVADAHRARLVPAITIAVAVVVSLLLLALGGHMLVDDTKLTLPAALVLALSLIGAVTGTTRLLRYGSRIGEFREACESVCNVIDRAAAVRANERMILGGLKHAIEMANVSMIDGSGRPLLDRISLRLEPGSLVAILGTDPVAVAAMVELLLGFGTPKTGAVRIDGVPISDLHDRWLSKNVLWVGRNGPIWSGTIADNLGYAHVVPDSGQISEATRKSGVYDRLQTLGDGFSTLLSADDGRLDESTCYGLAVARAWIRRPAVIVVQEAGLSDGTLIDDAGMDALCQLAREGSLVIVLPQRLRTLRAADRVILLNGSQLAGEGKHEELLAGSDLYRHLNYVLFNPYRHQAHA